jgi:hypothetical protein
VHVTLKDVELCFERKAAISNILGIAVGCIYKSYWIERRDSKSHLALLERRCSLREYESQDTELAELRLDESIN